MTVSIEHAQSAAAVDEFIALHDRVYESRSARWPADAEFHRSFLRGESAFCDGRTFRPLVAREHGEVVARVLALVDERYCRYWNERLGHLALFEALPGARAATRMLMDEACDWLAERGAQAARAGFWPPLDDPFVIDEYELLPPVTFRQNPIGYHALLKGAHFESEQGWADYRATVSLDLIERWERTVAEARARGFDIKPLAQLPEQQWRTHLTDTFNDTFRTHWGMPLPFSPAEFGEFLDGAAELRALETSVLAYRGGDPVGFVLIIPDASRGAVLSPGRTLVAEERVNFLAIGVRQAARGRGLNLAMAGHAFVELARRGAACVGYTLVLDDNWPSRRTGERLGADLCANYMVYRRDFHRR